MPIHVHLAAFPLSCRGSGRAKATQLARSVYHFSGLDVEAGVGFGGHDDSSHGRLRASISAVLQTRLWRGCLWWCVVLGNDPLLHSRHYCHLRHGLDRFRPSMYESFRLSSNMKYCTTVLRIIAKTTVNCWKLIFDSLHLVLAIQVMIRKLSLTMQLSRGRMCVGGSAWTFWVQCHGAVSLMPLRVRMEEVHYCMWRNLLRSLEKQVEKSACFLSRIYRPMTYVHLSCRLATTPTDTRKRCPRMFVICVVWCLFVLFFRHCLQGCWNSCVPGTGVIRKCMRADWTSDKASASIDIPRPGKSRMILTPVCLWIVEGFLDEMWPEALSDSWRCFAPRRLGIFGNEWKSDSCQKIAGLGSFHPFCIILWCIEIVTNTWLCYGFVLLHAAARNWISYRHPSHVPSASSSRDCHWARIQQYHFHLHALPDNDR